MKATPRAINSYIFFKLPSCYFTGVRVKTIDQTCCVTSVRHRWINQNPFKSMFWAVQGMAAELATGALVMASIAQSDAKISMLVATNNARFDKKATGTKNQHQINAYAISDNYETLDLFITVFKGSDEIATTNKSDIETAQKRICNFFNKCISKEYVNENKNKKNALYHINKFNKTGIEPKESVIIK